MAAPKHSFVHNIRIASPCSADWDKMTGDERTRFCQQCKLYGAAMGLVSLVVTWMLGSRDTFQPDVFSTESSFNVNGSNTGKVALGALVEQGGDL